MACGDIPKRIVSITHGGVTFAEPAGGTVQETVDYAEVRPGVRKAPCTYIRGYSLRATATWGVMATPIVRGTSDTLTFTLEQVDEGTTTVALATMRAGAAGLDMNGDPVHSQSMEFVFDSGAVDNLAPITVS